MSDSIPILTFHKVDPKFEWGATRISPFRFDQILFYLKSAGYKSVCLRELLQSSPQLPGKPVVITFDDAYESIYTHAFPAMQKYGFTSCTFVVTQYVGKLNTWDVNLGGFKFRHMSWEQMREMQKYGHEFESHTVTHPDLTQVNSKRLKAELVLSKAILEDRLGNSVNYLSFPFGKYNQQVLDFSRKAEYFKTIGVVPDLFRRNPYVVERNTVYLFDMLWNIELKLNNHFLSGLERLKLRIVNFCSYGTAVVKRKSYRGEIEVIRE